jgi:structural hemagglutinin/hemolysin toxin protein RtxA
MLQVYNKRGQSKMALYQIFVHVPETHLVQVKQAMFDAGAGKLGAYSHCSWEVKGEGQFRPEKGSNAYVGEIGKVEKVVEYRIYTFCTEKSVAKIIAAMKAAHPYEMPAYGVTKLEDF